MSRARSLSKLGNESNIFIDSNNNVGIGSTTPRSKLDIRGTATGSSVNVSGAVTATSFVGSGTSITGITGKAAAMTIVFG